MKCNYQHTPVRVRLVENPSPQLPAQLLEVLERSVTCEYVSRTSAAVPIAAPTTPYLGNGTIDVSTGLAYPAKAERARRDPRVALLFADPIGPGSDRGTVVLIQGHAAVRDANLQSNTDRYIRLSMAKLPEAFEGQPRFVLRRLAYYYARVWIEVTPLRVLWWPDRDLREQPQSWRASSDLALPQSDPAPQGRRAGAWLDAPNDWRETAARAIATLPLADLSVIDDNGYPLCVPVKTGTLENDELELQTGAGIPPLAAGPACLTVHGHGERFTGQENHTLIGELVQDSGRPRLRIERALASWSITGNRAQAAIGFLAKGRRLRPRLNEEAARRGQLAPKINID